MRSFSFLQTLFVCILVCNCVFLNAQSVTVDVPASADNTLFEESANLSNGSGQHFFAGNTASSNARRGLVRFDVGSLIPANAIVQDAKVKLHMSRTTSSATNISLHRVLTDWGEGTEDAAGNEGGGATATTGTATWQHTFYNTQFWTNPGGDFLSTADAITSVNAVGFYEWTSPALVATVQGWLDGSIANYGWLLLGDESVPTTSKRFDSRENPTAANRPVLQVTYILPPGNDLCEDAFLITGDTVIIDSTTLADVDSNFSCGSSNQSPSLWYRLTTNSPAVITANTCGSLTNYDTYLRVFTGNCNALQCITANDDACGLRSYVSFEALPGTDYWLLVGGYSSNSGRFELMVNYQLVDTTNNDSCINAQLISCGDTIISENVTADSSDNPSFYCGTSIEGPSRWYKIIGTGSDIVVSLCDITNGAFDTKLHVYEGSCDSLLCVGGNDDFCGYQSQITFTSQLNKTYYILVSGYSSATGYYTLTVNCQPPANMICDSAIALACGDTVMGNTELVDSIAAIPFCGGSPNYGIWYKYTATGYNIINVNTCDNFTNYDTKILVYTGRCDSLTCIGGNDDDCGLKSSVTWPGQPGQTYYIFVTGYSSSRGLFKLSLNCIFPPASDTCGGAIPVACGDTVAGSTLYATIDTPAIGSSTCGVPITAPGVWYTLNGTGDRIILSTCDMADYDTRISVWEGVCDSLVCIGGNDDGSGCSGFTSYFDFISEAGKTYYILVHGYSDDVGNFNLAVGCESGCPVVPFNDDCDSTHHLRVFGNGGCGAIWQNNSCASNALFNPPCDLFGLIKDLWYDFNTGNDTSVILHLGLGTATDIKFALYDGCNGNVLACNSGPGTFTLSGLTPNTNYLLQVWNNGAGEEGTFSICLESTSDTCNRPVNLWTSLVGPRSARLNWDPVPGAHHYRVRGRKAGSNNIRTFDIPNGAPTYLDISGLGPNQWYEWQVRSFCDSLGASASWYSDIDSFKTGCFRPDSTWETNLTATSVTLNWTPAGGVVAYRIRGRELPGGNWQTYIINAPATSASFSNLNPGKTYVWKVQSLCSIDLNGGSEYTPLDNFTTPSVPAAPDAFSRLDGSIPFDNGQELQLLVYPNPADNNLNIAITGIDTHLPVRVDLISMDGKHVITETIRGETTTLQWSLTGISAGVYQLQIIHGDKQRIEKVVIAR